MIMRIAFFFSRRRRHPRYWCDWSSDVCSSDLRRGHRCVGERAASLLGWRPLEVDHAPDPQLEVPATRAAASFALWRGDVADARRAVERGWTLVRRAEDWALTARMAATYLEVQAMAISDAHERRALAEI